MDLGEAIGYGAPGFAKGISIAEDIRGKREHLAIQKKSVGLQEKQLELAIQKLVLDAQREARQEQARGELAGMLEQKVNVPWNPDLGHEGEVPAGGAPVPKPVDPRSAAALMVRGGMVKTPKDLRSVIQGGGGEAPQESAPPGMQWAPSISAEGDRSYRAVPIPSSIAPSASMQNNPYAIARAAVGLKPGQMPDQAQAQRIYQIVEQHARSKGISPRAQVFNDVFASTGDRAAAEQAAAEFEEKIGVAAGRGRTVGAYGEGGGREARVGTTEATEQKKIDVATAPQNVQAEASKAATIAGEQTKAREVAQFEASLDLPITPAEAAMYRIPGSTKRRDFLAMQLKPVTEADVDAGTQFAAAKAMLQEYKDITKRLLTATDAAGAMGQRVQLGYGAFVRTNEDAVRLRALKATVPLLVRALGEKGTLATADIQRALDAVPDFGDTQQSAQAKIAQLEGFISTVESKIKSLRPGIQGREGPAAPAPKTPEVPVRRPQTPETGGVNDRGVSRPRILSITPKR